jgi:hypothetical protein
MKSQFPHIVINIVYSFAIATFACFACGCGQKTTDVTIYLKKNTGEAIRVPDCEIVILDRSSILKILELRKSIKDHYAIPMVGKETEEKLKSKNYQGSLFSDEIDQKLPTLEKIAKALDRSLDEIAEEHRKNIEKERFYSAIKVENMNPSNLSERIQYRRMRPELGLPTDEEDIKKMLQEDEEECRFAKEKGALAVVMLAASAKQITKTNLEGKATVKSAKDQFVFAHCLFGHTLVAWLLPSSKLESPNVEFNQSDAFIVHEFPQTFRGLCDLKSYASLSFWERVTTWGEASALSALLLSDQFYSVAKKL